MAEKKPKEVEKGLSDKELIERYEDGKVDMEESVKKMLDNPSPTQTKSDRQKIKR